MATAKIDVPPNTLGPLKAAAKQLGVPFPKLIQGCLFLSLIHLDMASKGAVRFKDRVADRAR